jgi:hypothetical protein
MFGPATGHPTLVLQKCDYRRITMDVMAFAFLENTDTSRTFRFEPPGKLFKPGQVLTHILNGQHVEIFRFQYRNRKPERVSLTPNVQAGCDKKDRTCTTSKKFLRFLLAAKYL